MGNGRRHDPPGSQNLDLAVVECTYSFITNEYCSIHRYTYVSKMVGNNPYDKTLKTLGLFPFLFGAYIVAVLRGNGVDFAI